MASILNTMSQPELYYVGETPYVPGSHLPIVVYRGAIAHCENEDAMKEALEANGGWKKGVSLMLMSLWLF
jgi:hypothetical protein